MANIYASQILTRYVLTRAIKPLLVSVSIAFFLLIGIRMTMILEIAMGKADGFGLIIKFISYWVPHYLGLCIPLGLFLGLLMGFSQLFRDRELFAMQSAGIGVPQLLRPAFFLALSIAIGMFLVYGWLQPLAIYSNKVLIHHVTNVRIASLIKTGQFNKIGQRTFFAENGDKGSNFHRVFIYEKIGKNHSVAMTAQEAQRMSSLNLNTLIQLRNGNRLEIRKDVLADNDTVVNRVDFSKYNFSLSKNSEKYRRRGISEYELTTDELVYSLIYGNKILPSHKISSELELRIAKFILIMLFPFAAMISAYSNPRNSDWWPKVMGSLGVVFLYETLVHGAILSRNEDISTYITMWTPLIIAIGLISILWQRLPQ